MAKPGSGKRGHSKAVKFRNARKDKAKFGWLSKRTFGRKPRYKRKTQVRYFGAAKMKPPSAVAAKISLECPYCNKTNNSLERYTRTSCYNCTKIFIVADYRSEWVALKISVKENTHSSVMCPHLYCLQWAHNVKGGDIIECKNPKCKGLYWISS